MSRTVDCDWYFHIHSAPCTEAPGDMAEALIGVTVPFIDRPWEVGDPATGLGVISQEPVEISDAVQVRKWYVVQQLCNLNRSAAAEWWDAHITGDMILNRSCGFFVAAPVQDDNDDR